MKSLYRIIALLASVICAGAQTSNNPARSPETDWNALVTLMTPVPPVAGSAPVTPVQRRNAANEQALRARQASQAARAFYTAYPNHIDAGEARKLEALMALQGVTDNDASGEQSAQQTARAYRENRNNPAAARFEVAVLSERVQARARLGGNVYGNNPAELEGIADRL